MRPVTPPRHIIFDFDGVLAETNDIRIEGFRTLFSSYPLAARDSLVAFARANGGLSRYVKIRYFFEEILGQPVSDKQIAALADDYSAIVTEKIIAAEPVKGSRELLAAWGNKLDFAIISGSDERELRSVCISRGIAHYFAYIFGSPATKQENFQRLFDLSGWQRQHSLFIGDTHNDLKAANEMGVPFLARASGLDSWKADNIMVISDLTKLDKILS